MHTSFKKNVKIKNCILYINISNILYYTQHIRIKFRPI